MKWLLPLLLSLTVNVRATASPKIISWSDKTYGFDGPWQAVTVQIGSNKQEVDLLPGFHWASPVFTTDFCDNKTISSTCYAEDAGFYDPGKSTSVQNASDNEWAAWFWDVDGQMEDNRVMDTFTLGSLSIPNVSTRAVHNAYQVYPNGHKYPISIGYLSLGAPAMTYNISGYNMTYIPSYLYMTGQIPSYSFGMHIGSVSPKIAPSLLLGGYDRNRVLGEISTQSWIPTGQSFFDGVLVIPLQDIGIGVVTGASPFSYTNKTGLLTQNNSSMDTPLQVEVSPIRPYLYLPQSTCDAITADLPVTYNEGLGLYTWNMSDSRYETIISSPTYLSFSFVKDSNNQESLTIKVPFALLNLTLEEPLTQSPTPYFPCHPYDGPPLLGRAFLQAAFLGVNWGHGTGSGEWFLAQAPGPGLVANPSVRSIEDDPSGSISGTGSSWEQSWAGHWTPISSNTTSTGLSTGAKAGIGVGCGIAGIVLLALAGTIIMRRRHSADNEQTQFQRLMGTGSDGMTAESPLNELESKGNHMPVEAPSEPMAVQLAAHERYEMP